MAFGKKKEAAVFTSQDEVALLATKFLKERRATRVRIALQLTFTSPVLMNQFSQKALVQMLSKQVGCPEPKAR